MRPFPSLVLSALLALTRAYDPDDLVLNAYFYCIKYYGSLSADIELPRNAIPDYNYNGTELCPLSFSTPYVSGVTLRICPPEAGLDTNNLALIASLEFHSHGGQLDGPIDVVELSPDLITNGSVSPSVFEGNGIPATLQKDLLEFSLALPTWTINGTQAALTSSPDPDDDTQSIYVSCAYDSFNQYCGGYEDRHIEGAGGCWRDQWIPLNMRTPSLNYTYRFDNFKATVDIAIASEYVTYMGNATGENTLVYLRFEGDRNLPSVVDYDFWTNADSNYEIETEFQNERTAMIMKEDSGSLVLLLNDTGLGGGGEWYDSANGTFSVQSINDGNGGGRVVDGLRASVVWVGVLVVWVEIGVAVGL